MRSLVVVSTLGTLLGCQQDHVVTVQLGPTEDTLTAGFTCVQDDDPTKLLAARAKQPDGTLQFRIVVDVISLGGQLPGCRGEELFTACAAAGSCTIVPRPDGSRFCQNITVDAAAVEAATMQMNLTPMLTSIRMQLQGAGAITLDAPDEPVVIRAVATTETCNQIDSFAFDSLIGCANSCPVQLDDVDGVIALSLDTLSRMCEREVRGCSVFPP